MKLSATIILLLGLALVLLACEIKAKRKTKFERQSYESQTKAIKVSMKELQTNYKSMEGKKVEAEGIVWFEFENVSICPSRNSLSSEEKSCFWLDFREDLNLNHSSMEIASGKKFLIKGIIDTSDTGHLGMYLGTIRDIYYIREK